ncbi:MAG TPA: hypothetical protein VIK35_09085 [Verrucomicrobiae bacterium]
MKTTNQPTLPGVPDKPAVVECSGGELFDLLASLRARGATVYSMTAICVGRWRLNLQWPPEKRGNPTNSRPAARKMDIRESFYETFFQK